jgi:hypothetical protein
VKFSRDSKFSSLPHGHRNGVLFGPAALWYLVRVFCSMQKPQLGSGMCSGCETIGNFRERFLARGIGTWFLLCFNSRESLDVQVPGCYIGFFYLVIGVKVVNWLVELFVQ